MAGRTRTVTLAGAQRACPCHACAFFASPEEENAVLLPFMAQGIAAGDRCVNIIDKERREERLNNLASAGIDVAKAERAGQLELRPWERAHLTGGRFDQAAMLDSLDKEAASGAGGTSITRFWSNQEWAAQDIPGVDDLVEYEARFNDIWPKYNDVFVCVYDTTRFAAAVLIQILCTHPVTIIGGIMLDNPFYVPPNEFLNGLHDQLP